MNTCEKFARLVAKRKGLTYTEATKKYPRGYVKNSVYYGNELVDSHCVHCARAEVLSKSR